MIRHLKTAQPAQVQADQSTQVQATVARIIADVTERGDEAVRQYSQQFDQWAPAQWRLTQEEVEACVASLSPREIEDIRFAQAQVRRFAECKSPP